MSKYPKHLAKLGVMFRLAVLDWSEDDVKSFVGMDNLNPLYRPPYNMGRVGCFPCLASGDKTKERAFAADDFGREQRAKVIRIGAQIGKQIFTSKGGRARNCDADGPGCAMCAY